MSQIMEDKIRKANAGFWEQMLSIRLEPMTASLNEAPAMRCIGVNHVVGHCDLTGNWVGRIEVRLSSGLALHATSAMLMQPEATVCADDTLDAIKEIANMIAGTLKSDLPSPCYITVPGAKVEEADVCVLPQTEDSVTVFFAHKSGELMVRVLQDLQHSSLPASTASSPASSHTASPTSSHTSSPASNRDPSLGLNQRLDSSLISSLISSLDSSLDCAAA